MWNFRLPSRITSYNVCYTKLLREVFVSAEYTQRVFVVQYRNNNTMVSRKVVFGK